MISRFQTRSQIPAGPAAGLGQDTPRHGGGEIGGKRFRVRFDGGFIRPGHRKKHTNMAIAMVAGWTVAIGISVYALATSSPDRGTVAAVCDASADGSSGDVAAGSMAVAHGPTNFNLNVFNSTNRSSLAARTAAQLQSRGFVIDMVSNDPLKSNLTIPAQVWGAKEDMSELRTVAAEVPGAQIMTDNRTDPSVDLILGAGFTALAKPSETC
jgi:hypothetical protein